MNLVEYPDDEMMMIDLANVLAGEINEALMNHDRVSFAVPGGTTPGPIFDALCAADLDWDRVHVFLTDERWVPEYTPRSNAKLVRERLLTSRAAAATFVPFYIEAPQPEPRLEELNATVGKELPISVLLLGMGEDMHTASLFPGAEGLAEALDDDAPPVLALRAKGVPEARVSLSLPVLNGAMSRHMVITGAKKRAALERAALLHDPMTAPVGAVLPGLTVHWAE